MSDSENLGNLSMHLLCFIQKDLVWGALNRKGLVENFKQPEFTELNALMARQHHFNH